MRATISFEIDLENVEDTMSVIIGQQSSALRIAATILDNAGKTTLLEEVSEALDLLGTAATQLQQYQQMLISFEKAKFDTMLPQPANGTIGDATQSVKKFDEFLEKINSQESPDVSGLEEG
jgi:hypothetical protein|tara:strand:+ start:228 stop:590 length:363 start_codon:yes stop_codon:yes gene_type:complete